MPPAPLRFASFVLDTANRRLTRDGAPVELNARYMDALALLAGDPGTLVSKERFMAEVWRGVPVTDEALTQCIRTLRRVLGDEAGAPRFIETVPKHGYRFIAPVEFGPAPTPAGQPRRRAIAGASYGATGGAAAGAIGGVIYGLTFEAQPVEPGIGAASVLIVLLFVCALVGAVGGAAIGGGIAAAGQVDAPDPYRAILGGGGGGMMVGALGKMLATDAFSLLLGRAPGNITGLVEGLVLGVAVGIGGWLGAVLSDRAIVRASIAAASGATAGVAIGLAGGRLMGGSLDLLAHGFAASRLRMDQIGRLFGEGGFGPLTNTITAGLEGALFAGCVVAALTVAQRPRGGQSSAAGPLGSPAAAPGRS